VPRNDQPTDSGLKSCTKTSAKQLTKADRATALATFGISVAEEVAGKDNDATGVQRAIALGVAPVVPVPAHAMSFPLGEFMCGR
jgi:hypothetical protein